MRLISPSNQHLACVNCGAVYLDRWPDDVSPVCPYCRCSHFIDSEDRLRGPTRKRYRVYEPSSDEPDLPAPWDRYEALRAALDKWEGSSDAMTIHRKVLRALRANVRPNLLRMLRQCVEETQEKEWREVFLPLFFDPY